MEGSSSWADWKGRELKCLHQIPPVISTLLPHFLAPRWRPTEQECCCRSRSRQREGSLCGFRADLFLTNFKPGLNLESLLHSAALPHSHKHQQFRHSGLHKRKKVLFRKNRDSGGENKCVFFFFFGKSNEFYSRYSPSPRLASCR